MNEKPRQPSEFERATADLFSATKAVFDSGDIPHISVHDNEITRSLVLTSEQLVDVQYIFEQNGVSRPAGVLIAFVTELAQDQEAVALEYVSITTGLDADGVATIYMITDDKGKLSFEKQLLADGPTSGTLPEEITLDTSIDPLPSISAGLASYIQERLLGMGDVTPEEQRALAQTIAYVRANPASR